MNQQDLQNITDEAFKVIEADVIYVLFSEEKGAQVIPVWERSCEFKTAKEMYDMVEKDFITHLIKFADETGSGNIIGAYALEWTDYNKE